MRTSVDMLRDRVQGSHRRPLSGLFLDLMQGSGHRAARVSVRLQSLQQGTPQGEVFRRDQDRDRRLGRVRGEFAQVLAGELDIAMNAARKLLDETKLLELQACVH